VQGASDGLNVLDLTTSIIRHRYINRFIIFKTPDFGKRQSVISRQSYFNLSALSKRLCMWISETVKSNISFTTKFHTMYQTEQTPTFESLLT